MKFEEFLMESEITDLLKELKGTPYYLKAPNGKKSNLPEKQWLMVRTKAFKKWFGDWENDPKNASKVVDKNGEPMIVYHQTANSFTEFDLDKIESAKGDETTPLGVFVKQTDGDIGMSGKLQMPLFANIKNPMMFSDRPHMEKYLRNNLDGWSDLIDVKDGINDKYKKLSDDRNSKMMDDVKKMQDSIGDVSKMGSEISKIKERYKSDGFFDEWRKHINDNSIKAKKLVTKHFKSNGYDGVIIEKDAGSFGRVTDATIAFSPNQIKSINNNGSFSKSNDNINESE